MMMNQSKHVLMVLRLQRIGIHPQHTTAVTRSHNHQHTSLVVAKEHESSPLLATTSCNRAGIPHTHIKPAGSHFPILINRNKSRFFMIFLRELFLAWWHHHPPTFRIVPNLPAVAVLFGPLHMFAENCPGFQSQNLSKVWKGWKNVIGTYRNP